MAVRELTSAFTICLMWVYTTSPSRTESLFFLQLCFIHTSKQHCLWEIFERFTYAPKTCRSMAISYHKMRLCNVPSLTYCVDIAQNSRLCIWSFTLLLICFSCLKGMTSAFVMIYWDANLSDRISKIKSFLPCYMSFTLCLCFSVRILISRCSGRRIHQSGSTIQTTSKLF